jgi:hypothetical protein
VPSLLRLWCDLDAVAQRLRLRVVLEVVERVGLDLPDALASG